MSRLAGFIITLDDEEIFAATWKNYMCMDSVIATLALELDYGYLVEMEDDNFTLQFNSYDDFVNTYYMAQRALLKKDFFEKHDVDGYDREDALVEWDMIFDKVDYFIETNPYREEDLKVEFFGCR